MPIDKVLSVSIANAAINASAISNTANLVIGALNTGNTVVTGTLTSNNLSMVGNLSVTGNTILTGAINNGAPMLTLTATSAPCTGFNWVSTAIANTLASNSHIISLIGQDRSSKNSGWIGYRHSANGSSNNILTFGLYDVNNALNINGDGKVGINTTTPAERLDVSGNIKTSGDAYIGATSERHYIRLSSNNWPELRYTTPSYDEVIRLGVAHQDESMYNVKNGDWYVYSNSNDTMGLIVRRATGYIITKTRPVFWVWCNNTSGYTTVNSPIPFNVAPLNTSSSYNTSTYKFTAPDTATYEFNAMGLFRQNSIAGASGELSLYINNTNVSTRGLGYAGGGSGSSAGGHHYPMHITYRVSLATGDTVDLRIQRIDSGADFYINERLSWFSGVMLG